MRNISAILMMIVVPLLFSCSNNDDWDAVSNGDLIREWHLIEVEQAVMFPEDGVQFSSVDYSDKKVIYDFQKGAIVKVSGVDEGDSFVIPNGMYSYEVIDEEENPNFSDGAYIEINRTKWGLTISENRLVLDQSYVDGPKLIFEPWEG